MVSIAPSMSRIYHCKKSRWLWKNESDFPEVGICGFEENFENKEEDDDFKLAVDDPWTHEKIRDAKEDEDEDDDNYYSLYRR